MSDMARIITFITDLATPEDLDRIIIAVNARTRSHRAVRAASVRVGVEVELTNIKPKALAGLTGEVVTIDNTKGRCDVRLDRGATNVLASSRTNYASRAVLMSDPEGRYLLTGVPLSACAVK